MLVGPPARSLQCCLPRLGSHASDRHVHARTHMCGSVCWCSAVYEEGGRGGGDLGYGDDGLMAGQRDVRVALDDVLHARQRQLQHRRRPDPKRGL